MKKDIAVRKIMLLDIKTNPNIPPELYSLLRYELELAYQVGYDLGWKEHNQLYGAHHKKPVVQIDKNGNVNNEYPSLLEAAIANKYKYNTLQKAIEKNRTTHNGRFAWKFKKDYDEKAITTSEHPYTFL